MVSFAAVVEQNHRSNSVAAPGVSQAARPRYINPSAGHALELLGHAIEYLLDDYARQQPPIAFRTGQLDAIQLLKSFNRQIYFECPQKPTLLDRLHGIFASKIAKRRSTQAL